MKPKVRPENSDDLLACLREQAAWLDQRAAVLRRAVLNLPHRSVARHLLAEAAGFDGRAAEIREAIHKATNQQPGG